MVPQPWNREPLFLEVPLPDWPYEANPETLLRLLAVPLCLGVVAAGTPAVSSARTFLRAGAIVATLAT